MTSEIDLKLAREALPNSGRDIMLRATAAQNAALAERFQLENVADYYIEAQIIRQGQNIILTGFVSAKIEQLCSLSLVPVWTDLKVPLHIRFCPEERIADATEIEDIEAEIDEALCDGVADIGEAVAQLFALEIPPYPRAKGADFTPIQEDIEADASPPSPFSVLTKLKEK